MRQKIKNYINLLENKWGKFETTQYMERQKQLLFLGENYYLNKLYNAISIETYDIIEKKFNIMLIPELKEFYKNYNGISLFYASFIILGINYFEDMNKRAFGPTDFIAQNRVTLIHTRHKDKYNNMIQFGICGTCALCYDKDDMKKIYSIEVNKGDIIHIFNSFNEAFDYYFEKLIEEYNGNGEKIHQDPNAVSIFRNQTREII